MDIVKFIDSHNQIIESRVIDKDSVYERNIFPKGTVGFTYYHNENSLTYIIGVPLKKFDVIKKVNEKMYKEFIEFGKMHENAKYLITFYNNQIYFICTPSDIILVSNFDELSNCLYQLLYENSLQVKTKK